MRLMKIVYSAGSALVSAVSDRCEQGSGTWYLHSLLQYRFGRLFNLLLCYCIMAVHMNHLRQHEFSDFHIKHGTACVV